VSKVLVRLVGGESSGDEVWHDPDKQGPVIRTVLHPDFNVCRDCVPDEDTYVPSKMVIHYEEYLIHKVNYDSGHFHFYAAPPKWRLVDLMNHLWDGYKDDADMERRNGH
jgi:hypothetical protein